ncbi:hypothetical protein ADL19_10325 [Streptomyces purpurogeneiscleroticus]|nr:hypothetical protein ADL19_10325 [Streptomyces purpurogeneiscleroticus]
MEIDENRIADAVLALLYLTLDRDCRAWKGFQWEAMTRLHAKGMIGNPVGKSKFVMLTDEGVKRSEKLFREMFGRPSRWGVGRPLRAWLPADAGAP